MERFIVALCITLSMGAVAQVPEPSHSSSTPDPQRVRHFWLGASFASELAYRTLLLNERSDIYKWIIDGRNDREIPRFGYTAKLSMTYEFNRHWSVGIGVGYSKKGFRTRTVDSDHFIFRDYNNPEGGVSSNTNDPAIPQKLRNVYGFAYITIPVQLSYVAGKGKIRSISSIGMSVDMLDHATSVFVVKYLDRGWERKTTDQTEQFSQWNLTPMVSTGIAMQMGSRLRFTLAPVARYGLLRIIDTPITGRLWSVGLEAGCYWAL